MTHAHPQIFQLDNAAKIYPAAMSRRWKALFRVSAELDESIDTAVLQKAQENVLRRFPTFALRLRKGVFWYYLEHMDNAPAIQDDVANPCAMLNIDDNMGFMFRIRVYNKRLAVEFFHVLTDGTGGMIFLKTLLAEYISIRYGVCVPRDANIPSCEDAPQKDEFEDAFPKFARGVTRSRKESVSYRIQGTQEGPDSVHIVTGMMDAEKVHALAKGYGATVTQLLTAVMAQCIYRMSKADHSKARRAMPIKVCVPINLRGYYPTRTMRNFASYVNVGIEPELGEYSFEEILECVKHGMATEASEKVLNAKMSTNVMTEKNKVLRAAPLFIKNPTMKLAFKLNGDRNSSTSLSNLGVVRLPQEMCAHVKRLDFLLGPLSYNRVTAAAVTYNGLMCVNFTRTICEPTLERLFFTTLVKMGIHVKLESNESY